MRFKTTALVGLLILLFASCGGSGGAELQAKNDALSKRVDKLEDDLHEANRKLIAHEQAIQTMNERLKTVEVGVDKLAYGSSSGRP